MTAVSNIGPELPGHLGEFSRNQHATRSEKEHQ
jgi:hypothetical protein